MPLASIGRRHLLQVIAAGCGGAAISARAVADPAAIAPIQQLCSSLISVMRAGSGNTPFAQRFAMLAPVIDRTFNLPAILQVSVGPTWSSLPPDQQASLLATFRRYTIASYVNSFDSYNGQRCDVLPDVRSTTGGEQVVQTRIVSSDGDNHKLDYVMRPEGGTWRVVDVLADGSISRVAVQRSDFRRLLSQGGGQALVASLQRKTNDLSGGAAIP